MGEEGSTGEAGCRVEASWSGELWWNAVAVLLMNSDMGTDDVSGVMVEAMMRWRRLGRLELARSVGVD